MQFSHILGSLAILAAGASAISIQQQCCCCDLAINQVVCVEVPRGDCNCPAVVCPVSSSLEADKRALIRCTCCNDVYFVDPAKGERCQPCDCAPNQGPE